MVTPPCRDIFRVNPVVPGVVLLDEAFARILEGQSGLYLAALDAVKFTAPVSPGEEVTLEWQEVAPTGLTFACFAGQRVVLRGRARLARNGGP